MPSLSEQTIVLSAGKAAKGLAYLAFSVGMARLYDSAQYAAFQTWWTVFMLVVPIAEGGFTAALYHRLPRLGEPERNGLVWKTFWVLAAIGTMLAAAITFLAAPLAAWFENPQASAQLIAIAPFIGSALPLFALQAWLLVGGRSIAVAWLDIAGAVATGAALLVPALFGSPPATGLALLSIYGVARTLMVAAYLHRKLNPRAAAGGLGDQLSYATQVSSSRAMGIVTKQLDRFFVGGMASPQAFSIYATGALEIPVINVVTASAATVLAPEISRRLHENDRAGALRLWHESIRKVALILFPTGVLFAVLAPALFTALYGPAFADASLIFQIFSLALPLRAAQYGAVLLAAGESARVFWGSMAGLAVNAGLCLWWVPMWSGAGAALATVISVYAVVGVYVPALSRVFCCSASRLFPWRDLAKIAGACAPAAAVVFLVIRFVSNPWPQLAAGSGVFTLTVLPAAWLLGAVREDDRSRLGRFLARRQHV